MVRLNSLMLRYFCFHRWNKIMYKLQPLRWMLPTWPPTLITFLFVIHLASASELFFPLLLGHWPKLIIPRERHWPMYFIPWEGHGAQIYHTIKNAWTVLRIALTISYFLICGMEMLSVTPFWEFGLIIVLVSTRFTNWRHQLQAHFPPGPRTLLLALSWPPGKLFD